MITSFHFGLLCGGGGGVHRIVWVSYFNCIHIVSTAWSGTVKSTVKKKCVAILLEMSRGGRILVVTTCLASILTGDKPEEFQYRHLFVDKGQ